MLFKVEACAQPIKLNNKKKTTNSFSEQNMGIPVERGEGEEAAARKLSSFFVQRDEEKGDTVGKSAARSNCQYLGCFYWICCKKLFRITQRSELFALLRYEVLR